MTKPVFALLSIFLILTACATPQAGADTQIPSTLTAAPGLQSTSLTQPPSATPFPTASEISPTAVPATPEATSTLLPRLEADAPVALASIHMIDPEVGWGIEQGGHLLRTRDGGNIWQDVTPPQGLYNKSGFFALDATTAWATPKPSDSCDATQMVWSEYQKCLPGPDIIFWRTVDGGQTWQASGSRGVESEHYRPMAIQFIDARTGWFLYVSRLGPMGSTTMEMLKTEDGGISWTVAFSPQSVCIHRTMTFINAQDGWSGADCRFVPLDWLPLQEFLNGKMSFELYQTSDGAGSNWGGKTLPYPQTFPTELTVSTADPNFVIFCGTTNMERISPKAFTVHWTCSMNHSASPETDFSYQFLTSDSGRSWHSWLSTGNEFFLNAQTGWRLYTSGAGQAGQLQQTLDSGQTWTTIKAVAWESAQFDFISETEGWAIVASAEALALTRTSDGGKTWDELKPRIASPLTGLFHVDMVSENVGWALAHKSEDTDALLYTTDGGLTWTDITPLELVDSSLRGIFLDEQTAWTQKCENEALKCKLLRTTNGGRTWTVQTENIHFDFYFTSITFLNENDGLVKLYDVGAGHGVTVIYQTQDGGTTWKQLMLNNPNGMVGRVPGGIDTCNICGDVFYYSSNRMIIIRGDLASDPGGAVYLSLSTDLGNTWKDLRLPLPDSKFADGFVAPMQPVFFNDSDGVLPFEILDQTFVNGVTAIYSTHDGGQTWQTNSTVLENASSIAFLSPQDAFAVCGNTLCVTHDGAQTWQTLSTNLNFGYSDSSEYVEKFHFITPSLGWALTAYNSSHTLWKTSDGGTTWEELKPVIANP
jgi:photosystem II stability/assembly factor-like uncharacterized protein